MSADLNQRHIMRGVQCVCGQWWPDYVLRAGAALMECCGSTYQFTPMSEGAMLCLLHDATAERMTNDGKEPQA